MSNAYEEAQSALEEYGIQLPDIDDNRRTWRKVQERIQQCKKDIVIADDPKEKASLRKQIESTEKEFLNVYHTKLADMYPHLLYENGEDAVFWLYDEEDGVYKVLNFSMVRSLVMRALLNDGLTPTTTWARECLSRYRAEYPDRGYDYNEFDTEDETLHLENGWLDLNTFEFTKHTPDKLSTIKSTTVYDKKAICPTYDTLFDSWEMTPDQVSAIDEFSGNTLTTNTKGGRMLVLEGQPGTGKSLLANIWTHILGDVAVREYSLDTFSNNPRFCKGAFVGKRLVWFNETDPKRTQLGAELQKMIDGFSFNVERKGVSKETEHKNLSKCLLTTNGLPDNMGDGMESRIIYIQYTKVFRGTHEENANLFDTVMEEKSGILNRMISGLKQYRKNGNRYTKIEKQDEIMDEYKTTSSLPIEFFDVHFDPIEDISGETFLYTNSLYAAFLRYVNNKPGFHNSPEKFMREINRRMPRRFRGLFEYRRKRDGRGVVGATLKFGFKWGDDFEQDVILPNYQNRI